MDQTGLLALLLESTTLKWVPRSGWLMRGVTHPESVADHVYGVAFMALAVADVLQDEGRLREKLDLERLLAIALLHDLGEARLTDLPSSAISLLPKTAKSEAEDAAVSDLVEPLPSARRWKALWTEFEEASTPEGRLVRDLDKLEMMVQCLRYEMAGQRGLDEFWKTMDRYDWHFALCRNLYERLSAVRGSLMGEAKRPAASTKRKPPAAGSTPPKRTTARKPGGTRSEEISLETAAEPGRP